MQYEFNIGDEVITHYGERGTIIDICECSDCEKRGFYEPLWRGEDGNTEYITAYHLKNGFSTYYKIGKHRFGNFDKSMLEHFISGYEKTLARLKKQLSLIEELERGESDAREE